MGVTHMERHYINRCVYGVFDPVGYDAEGKYGNEWENDNLDF